MGVAETVSDALAKFEKENPGSQGKAYGTSSDRTVAEQIEIILDPKRKDNYVNGKEQFKSKFKLTELPDACSLTAEQRKWWEKNVESQAGKSPGYAHVGGFAQDISVKNLTNDEKLALRKVLQNKELSVLMEKVTGTTSEYGVSIEQANVFHVTGAK